MEKEPVILAIESSCDDTSAAVLVGKKVLSNCIAGQKIHEKYGGVVPELASRAHQENIVPVVNEAIKESGFSPADLDAIAFTRGPGLMGSLIVGTNFAKGLALGLNIPLVEVNHMKAHILAHLIDDGTPTPTFPFMCLTVSGGHTQIVLVKSPHEYELIGETIDDAAGEAFDKGAKTLGLPYPGGPLIDKLAKTGDITAFPFPHPAVQGLNYSFSGLKTSLLYRVKKMKADELETALPDICASYQHSIVQFLLSKLKKAAIKHRISNIAIAGGVSANSYLREKITEMGEKEGWQTFIPDFQFCTDNAAMIGIAGYYNFLKGDFCTADVSPNPRMKINVV